MAKQVRCHAAAGPTASCAAARSFSAYEHGPRGWIPRSRCPNCARQGTLTEPGAEP